MERELSADVAHYLANVSTDEARAALLRLRDIILDEVPLAEEKISYGIPTYRFKGHLVSIAAFKKHCSFFPGYTVQEFLIELKDFKLSTGTIQFKPASPIPEDLVRRMLRARVAENESAAANKKPRASKKTGA